MHNGINSDILGRMNKDIDRLMQGHEVLMKNVAELAGVVAQFTAQLKGMEHAQLATEQAVEQIADAIRELRSEAVQETIEEDREGKEL